MLVLGAYIHKLHYKQAIPSMNVSKQDFTSHADYNLQGLDEKVALSKPRIQKCGNLSK